MPTSSPENRNQDFATIKTFYDGTYHKNASPVRSTPGFYKRLANRLGIKPGERVLDVACGTGEWLLAARERQASVAGTDISERAISVCRETIPQGHFEVCPAEQLPFNDACFDWITCLGSLEHFLNKDAALSEMIRVGTPEARYLILVPNSGFLTRRLGLFRGTEQAAVREDVLSLEQWQKMFECNGLAVAERWADLHVLSLDWIEKGPVWRWPLRLAQALSLAVWPLRWQYQVFHLCRKAGQVSG